MPWEHELQASVSTAFSSSPKLSQVFLYLNRDTANMFSFSISFRKHRDKEGRETTYYTLIIKMKIPFARAIITSTAHASSVSPSSYRNTIFIQSALNFLGLFAKYFLFFWDKIL